MYLSFQAYQARYYLLEQCKIPGKMGPLIQRSLYEPNRIPFEQMLQVTSDIQMSYIRTILPSIHNNPPYYGPLIMVNSIKIIDALQFHYQSNLSTFNIQINPQQHEQNRSYFNYLQIIRNYPLTSMNRTFIITISLPIFYRAIQLNLEPKITNHQKKLQMQSPSSRYSHSPFPYNNGPIYTNQKEHTLTCQSKAALSKSTKVSHSQFISSNQQTIASNKLSMSNCHHHPRPYKRALQAPTPLLTPHKRTLQAPNPLITPHQTDFKLPLIQQLESQIDQLLPLRYSFGDLSYYRQQLKSQYDDLDQEMKETHMMKSYNLLKERENSQKQGQLKILQLEYEQLGEYLNSHLIMVKLPRYRQSNKQLCVRFNAGQQQINTLKHRLKHNVSEGHQLTQDLEQVSLKVKDEQQKLCLTFQSLQQLAIRTSDMNSNNQRAAQQNQQVKAHQKQTLKCQSRILEKIMQSKQENARLIQQAQQVQAKLNVAQDNNTLLRQRKQHLTKRMTESKQLNTKIKAQSQQNYLLNNNILETITMHQESLSSYKGQLILINQTHCPQIQQQIISLLSQNTKSTQFLSYLTSYSQQLKQTSSLMYSKLNECCKQDYEKILKSRDPHSNQIEIKQKANNSWNLVQKDRYFEQKYQEENGRQILKNLERSLCFD